MPKTRTVKATRVGAVAANAAAAKKTALAAKDKKLRALVALIERRKARIVEDFYDIGEALRTILREELFVARARSFRAFCEAELSMDPATAFKLVAVVEGVPREQALALGQEKSYALVTYAAATAEADTPAGLLQANAKVGKRSVREASANEIKGAAAAVRRERAGKRADPALTAAADRIAAAIAKLKVGAATISLRGRTITVRVTVR